MTTREIKAYQTADGRIFADLYQALKHEFRQLLEEGNPLTRSDPIDAIMNKIAEKDDDVIRILTANKGLRIPVKKASDAS